MIGHLRGVLLEKHPNQVIVDVQGVGYEVTIPISTYTSLPGEASEVRLRIYTHVREDAIALFGFLTPDEKTLFEKLIGVSGVGPKLAITVLSGLPVGELVTAIRGGQLAHLTRIPGVGKKTAERLVLELKDKLDMLTGTTPPVAAQPGPIFTTTDQDVISALLNLGCARPAAEQAIKKAKAAGAPDEFEPLFRRSLELVR